MSKDGPLLVTPEEALAMLSAIGVNLTVPTMHNWCKDRGFGHQLPNGRWMVYRHKIEEVVDAASEAARSDATAK